ncbi:hypothetical protein BD324DRAFT_666398 [Kockovaella imperatae]|uniref:Uncharacterized protein n=1 Tax=Kockovaella imperatae TaxID=4999 RepID=A0A1Y1U8Y9_9TREE|nr:hypothetical protein BD324DRAFT_666398 [Kockovaella imperatae]ORX33575.1 hypothetical protein BD324DRAFT_666398 [Kockovaella imperatae]
MDGVLANLASANENTWMLIGAVAEQMQDQDRALQAFENALRHNPSSVLGLNAVASIARSRDNFDKAIEYFQRILNIKQDNGEAWGSMGHCLLMKDDLPKAYTAYQQALYHLQNPNEPKLWYGIGILYDRYGSFDHAEEAFRSVLKNDPTDKFADFDKANEIYFRLGIIYKHQRKYQASLDCFKYILNNPPRPLTSWDIWFQLGHVYEQDRDFDNARDAYMRVLTHQPDHAKVLQQLGWLHHQPGASFADQEQAVNYLTKSLETDGSDAQSWYLLGRAFMAGQRYNKAYEAYQQAVYRDGRNPTFWCSIGVLYYQINQYRDALDAYSRAIRLNPYISEVWYNLGSLYESCNNQITDAIDAYSRAADLDPNNATIKQRLDILQNAGNQPLPPAPGPVDVHPSQYTAQPQGPYPPGTSPGGSPRGPGPQHPGMDGPPGHAHASGPDGGRALPPPPPGSEMGRGQSPGPFRGGGGAPPPLQHVDESRGSMSRHAPLAPMETERPGNGHRDHRMYEPGPDRRHAASPASPRRRAHYPNPGPPSGGSFAHPADRDEWERRERDRAGKSSLGPSPRVPDRRPSPRDRPHGEYPYNNGGGRYEEHPLPPPINGNGYASAGHARHPSLSKEDPRLTTNAPSPSLSIMSTASGSKKRNRSTSKRSGAPGGDKKRKGTNSPPSVRGREEGSERGSERGSVRPDRAVDEGEREHFCPCHSCHWGRAC